MSPLRLLLCMDGSAAALEAARLAVRLVADFGGEIRAVTVLEDGATARQLDAQARAERPTVERPAAERLERGMRSVLDRVTAMAGERGVPVETEVLRGESLRSILRDAHGWTPDLVLVGRTGRSGPHSPMVGSLVMHLLEFTDWPVVVVPETDPDDPPDPVEDREDPGERDGER